MSSNALIGRQPILNRNGDVYAYELLFRSSDKNSANVTNNTLATASVLVNALNSIGLGKLIGSKKAFINVDEELLFSSAIEGLPKEKFVIEILETVIVTEDVAKRVEGLKKDGFTFAIDDLDISGEQLKNFEPIMPFTTVLKVDIMAAGGIEGVKDKISAFDKIDTNSLPKK